MSRLSGQAGCCRAAYASCSRGHVPEWVILLGGTTLVLLGAFSFVAGVWQQLYSGAPPPKSDAPQLPPWILVAVNGTLVVVAVSALIGIWSGRAGPG